MGPSGPNRRVGFGFLAAPGPLADWTAVYVPAWNDDLHLGRRTGAEVPGVEGEQDFVGAVNVERVVDALAGRGSPDRIVFAGIGAGGAGALVHAPRVADVLDAPELRVLIDGMLVPVGGDLLPPCLVDLWADTWGATAPAGFGLPTAGAEASPHIYRHLADRLPRASFTLAVYEDDPRLRRLFGLGADDCALVPDPVPVERYAAAVEQVRSTVDGLRSWEVVVPAGTGHTVLDRTDADPVTNQVHDHARGPARHHLVRLRRVGGHDPVADPDIHLGGHAMTPTDSPPTDLRDVDAPAVDDSTTIEEAMEPGPPEPLAGRPRQPRRSRRGLLAFPFRALAGGAGAAGLLAACDLTDRAAVPGSDGEPPSGLDRHVHLLRRLAYGPTTADLEHLVAVGEEAWLSEQLDPGTLDDSAVDEALGQLPVLTMTAAELVASAPDNTTARLAGAQLKLATLIRQVGRRGQLHERMVEFWSDHLNVPQQDRLLELGKIVEDREVIRPHGLGRFKDLLVASAQSPAMLYYLDNARSFADAINENYARELLELHTVGREGGYTEDDVVALARLLTGWTVDRDTYQFVFRGDLHDDGPLTIMDWQRPSGGDPFQHGVDFLHHLAGHPATARHVCRKLAVRFVADVPDESLVDAMADTWLANDSAVGPVIRAMVGHPAFEASAGNKFSRPWDYVVSVLRATDADITPATSRQALSSLGAVLSRLGQLPFGWDAPNGYPDVEGAWLNAGSLLNRWNFVGDALVGALGPVVTVGPGDLPTRLAGRPGHEIHAEMARTVRFEEITQWGRTVLRTATGWDDETVPSDSELREALPDMAIALLTGAGAQYR
ncbi:MAG: DUF1800 domain-containing protein [Acidimicrobiia bacterium]|nr:DUF1800 domain-containing protein [Acidimicrobiia bacterium]